jgi:hypothetical protein
MTGLKYAGKGSITVKGKCGQNPSCGCSIPSSLGVHSWGPPYATTFLCAWKKFIVNSIVHFILKKALVLSLV